MIYIPEVDDIYFQKTREYFDEVLSSYANGNYRSAVVMLYSVAICDLLSAACFLEGRVRRRDK